MAAWDLLQLVPNLMKAYTNTIPTTIFWGVLWAIVAMGIWRRNRSVRLVCVTFGILGAFIFTASSGLLLGIPASEKGLGLVIMAAGFAGAIFLPLIKK